MSRIILLPKHLDGTKKMIEELIQDGEKSILFKHIRDFSHPLEVVSCDEHEFPAVVVTCCQDILDALEPTIKTIGIENFDKFNYNDMVKFLKKLIRKDYKIILTGKNIIIDKFST